jgi:hypothetical protein
MSVASIVIGRHNKKAPETLGSRNDLAVTS